jgi:predicted dehydrogenase
MNELRVGVVGCGYFARNHLFAWNDVDGAVVTAVCDRDLALAERFAADFGVPLIFEDPEELLRSGAVDFLDIVTPPATHRDLVELAARYGSDVICQKPMAPQLDDARAMVTACSDAGVRFMVHENFRWQTPMRSLKEAAAEIGTLFWGRIHWRSAHDVYRDQPYLATDERFILSDLGVHLLDLARFFFGEATSVGCRTQSVNPRVQGEDVATALLGMESGATCVVDMSYASRVETEPFPQTYVHLEGSRGSAVLGHDFLITLTNEAGVSHRHASPAPLDWADLMLHHIQESVVRIQQHWVTCLREGWQPETSGLDNLRTLELVEACYRAAESQQVCSPGQI